MCQFCDDTVGASTISRRHFVGAALAATAVLAVPKAAQAAQVRTLSFYHTHTGERLRLTYAERGRIIPEALEEVSNFLRDFRTGDRHQIDPGLLDVLHQLRDRAGSDGTYEIISAFRSPRTNQMLRNNSTGVAEGSLHMQGRAIDVRLRGVPTARLREIALDLKAGGVGYYPGSDFIHVDTGRVRFW